MRLFTTVFTASLFVLIAVVGLFEFIPATVDAIADVGFVDFVLSQGVDVVGGISIAITPIIWLKDIEENLHPDNAFYLNSTDYSEFLEGDELRLPQAGLSPNVEKNRQILPATPTQRVDDKQPWKVHEFTTDPVLLKRTEELEVSYNKRASIMADNMNTLRNEIAEMFIEEWCPTLDSNIVRSSGTSRAAKTPGQTGNRKAITYDDFVEVARIRDNMDYGSDGWFAGVPGNLMADIRKFPEFLSADKLAADLVAKGVVGQLLGFNIYNRSSFGRFTNDATPQVKAYDSAMGATDHLGILCWHTNAVVRIIGSQGNGGIEEFADEKSPTWYGDVFSALVRAGGGHKRKDQRGVVALVEATA